MYIVSLLNSRNFFPLAIDGTPTEYSRFTRNKKNCPTIKLDISDRQKPDFIRITPFNILVTRIDSKILWPAAISRNDKNKKKAFFFVTFSIDFAIPKTQMLHPSNFHLLILILVFYEKFLCRIAASICLRFKRVYYINNRTKWPSFISL